MNDKPVAKSLHTITVIQQVYGYRLATNGNDAAEARTFTADLLGFTGRADPYGLMDKALKALGK